MYPLPQSLSVGTPDLIGVIMELPGSLRKYLCSRVVVAVIRIASVDDLGSPVEAVPSLDDPITSESSFLHTCGESDLASLTARTELISSVTAFAAHSFSF